MAILANAMVGHGGVPELYSLTRAEYFIPAYHFVYPEEDYFFRAMARHWGGRVSGIFLFVPSQLYRPSNTLGSSDRAAVSCESEGAKNVS